MKNRFNQKYGRDSLIRAAVRGCYVGETYLGEAELGGAPSIGDAMRFTVQRPWEAEGIRQRLYDNLLYPTAGATQFRFFQNPLGQGLSTSPGNANNPKQLSDTNLTQAGTLPSPQMFLCTSIELNFMPGSVPTANTFTPQVISTFIAVPVAGTVPISSGALNDLNAILPYGWLNFTIMSKSYLTEAGLISFPPKVQLQVDSSVSTNSGTTGTIAIASGKAGGRPYYMNPPVLLMPTANFEITVNFPVVIATPSGFNGRIGCILDGFLYRNAQ